MSTPVAEDIRDMRRQLERLAVLGAERRHNLSPDMLTKTLTISQIQGMTRFLERQPYRDPKVQAVPPARRQPAQLPSNSHFRYIEPGRYATVSPREDQDYDFFEVSRGAEDSPKWAGFTFVERIVGGQENKSIRGEQARRYLLAIEEFGVEKSRLVAAQELKQCMDCGRHLTDEESRLAGKGPWCRNK